MFIRELVFEFRDLLGVDCFRFGFVKYCISVGGIIFRLFIFISGVKERVSFFEIIGCDGD